MNAIFHEDREKEKPERCAALVCYGFSPCAFMENCVHPENKRKSLVIVDRRRRGRNAKVEIMKRMPGYSVLN